MTNNKDSKLARITSEDLKLLTKRAKIKMIYVKSYKESVKERLQYAHNDLTEELNIKYDLGLKYL